MTDQAGRAGSIARAHGFDASKPNVARVYDYLLGGKDNFAADRDAAQRLIEALPNAARMVISQGAASGTAPRPGWYPWPGGRPPSRTRGCRSRRHRRRTCWPVSRRSSMFSTECGGA